MTKFNYKKYPRFSFAPQIINREWPNKTITKAPDWCSVDLRDGNQALIDPMTVSQKIRFWDILLGCGFSQIETGFPSASQTEFDFHRKLITENRIPDDVTIQVLVQAREQLIERTFESLKGVKKAIVHVYNSTSKVQREKAFQMSKEQIKEIAVKGAKLLKKYSKENPNTDWTFEYSPESFSQTEPDFAIEVVESVCRVWRPEDGQKVIINLPATVEASMPNVFADQVEYFCKKLPSRPYITVSLHTHNDRGCAIAAAEMGIIAGADRIEGTLFGNGERTGNMDIVTMAMNLYSQGIDPELDFSNMSEITQVVSECNNLPIHPRHPYVGELVFTAFSGSHQDAIKKCLEKNNKDDRWNIAYLPIDPSDIGRNYQDVVRINSQSGKGGIAYVLNSNKGIDLPRWVQIDFSKTVQKLSEDKAKELSINDIWESFQDSYINNDCPFILDKFSLTRINDEDNIKAVLITNEGKETILGQGIGTLTSFVRAMETFTKKSIRVLNYSEHALSAGTRAQAMAYVQININDKMHIGVAQNQDTVTAMLKATIIAINNSYK